MFKTAGRVPSIQDQLADSDATGGGPALPTPDFDSSGAAASAEVPSPADLDVTFGVFVAGKWTHDMVKRDVQGDGLAGDNYFLFRLDPGTPTRVMLDDDDVGVAVVLTHLSLGP